MACKVVVAMAQFVRIHTFIRCLLTCDTSKPWTNTEEITCARPDFLSPDAREQERDCNSDNLDSLGNLSLRN
jgi:hypothetical protein